MIYLSQNPLTEDVFAEFPTATPEGVEKALQLTFEASKIWRQTDLKKREQLLEKVATLLEERAEEFSVLMAREMGKPVTEGVAEVQKCALTCRYYIENAGDFLRPQQIESDASSSFVIYEPLGPVLAIMPWNFPFWQVFRFAAPNLMAGNTVVLKHAPTTPQCALEIADLFQIAGFPEGTFVNLFLDNDQAAEVIADKRIRGVTLTGSTAAGRTVSSLGGKALKPMVMELGGSDPFIVLDDADVKKAASTAVISRCLNSGQSCISAKRFLVHKAVYKKFLDKFVAGMKARVVGDPLIKGVTIGPMARRDLRDALARQVEESVRAGARVLCGGEVPDGKGYFYPPTVLVDIPAGCPADTEELFGPVASVYTFETDEEMLALANHEEYGLGASIWSNDRLRAASLIARIEAGAVFINGMVKSDPRLPFGGSKCSGFGRELAREGILEFVNQKTVWMGDFEEV
ncbi:MAG: NAD-dependent succinate-semialdehyde dehydrogenase [Candidatus Sumerlaeia bacterium]|nr:NAD-dependent succinate-semialdehyde dehydrogenase [Candidatus Sumerlaeia bacterium]